MQALKIAGFNVFAFAPKSSFLDTLKKSGITCDDFKLSPYGSNPFKAWNTARQIRKLLSNHKINLAFSYTIKINIYTAFAKVGLPCKLVAVQPGLGEIPHIMPPLKRKSVLSIYKQALMMTDQLWVLNKKDRNFFLSKRLIPVHKLQVLPSEGINTSYFQPQESQRKKAAIRFVMIARLIKPKGVFEYVEAARKIKKTHPDVTFELVGLYNQNHPRAITNDTILTWQKEGLIDFVSDQADIRPYLKNADCMVLPSYYNEGVSRVLLEAGSMEKPIITTNHVGCKELVRDRISGFLVPVKDAKALVSAMEEMIQMSDTDRMVMGKNSREHIIKHFHIQRIFPHYSQIIEHVFNQRLIYKSTDLKNLEALKPMSYA